MSDQEGLQSWLDVLSQSIPGYRRGVITNERLEVLVSSPRDVDPGLMETAASVLKSPGTVIHQIGDDADPALIIGRKITSGDDELVLAVQVAAPLAQQEAISRLLDWSVRFLPLCVGTAESISDWLPRITELLGTESLDAGLGAFATWLAQRWQCTRVFIAITERGQTRIAAISHTITIDRRASLLRDLVTLVDRLHARDETAETLIPDLSQRHELNLTTAMGETRSDREPVATILADGGQVTDEAARLVATLVTEVVRQRQPQRHWLTLARTWFGPRYLTAKLVGVGLVILLAILALTPTDHLATGAAVLEGRVQRAVVVPFDGYIEAQFARAGENIEEDQLLARMEQRALQLEEQRILNALGEAQKEYQQALSELNQSSTTIAAARLQQVEAQLGLVQNQLTRTELRSPMSGVIIQGDLSRSLGAPVKRGDVVFEIAPKDDYRIAIRLPERYIADIQPGQTGRLLLRAFPDREFTVRITSIGEAIADGAESGVVYRIEAAPDDAAAGFRPGMSGVARVSIGQASMLWVYTGNLVERVQTFLWRWLP